MSKKLLIPILFILALAISLSPAAQGALLTHLEFEGNTTDSTGNIAYTGTPGAYVSGPTGFGQAMQFQKASSNVVYAEGIAAQLASLSTEITITMWAKGSSLLPHVDPTVIFSANDPVVWSRISLQYPWDVNNDYLFFDSWSNTGAFDRLYKYTGSNQFYKDGNWHHLAFVKNTALGDTGPTDARMKIYVDGTLWHDSATGPYGGGNGTGNLSSIANIYLGAEKQSWFFWDGSIDDFRIYDTELMPSEIQNLMMNVVKASNPTPAHQATDISTDPNLSWDSDPSILTHDIYLGTDSVAVDNATIASPEYQTTQPGNSFDPGTLAYSTTFFWRIDTTDGVATAKGDLWSFTTSSLPGPAINPAPTHQAIDIGIDADLSWNSDYRIISHDIFLGTDSGAVDNATIASSEYQTTQPGSTYDPGTLAYDTTFYWRIDDSDGSMNIKGAVWSFTTASAPTSVGKASVPVPANNSQHRPINTMLHWTPGDSAESHNVFLGTDLATITTATVGSSAYMGNVTTTDFDPPGLLENGRTYYWRIDGINGPFVSTGDVWAFSTIDAFEDMQLTTTADSVEIGNSIQKVNFTKQPENRVVPGFFSNAANFNGTVEDRLAISSIPQFNSDILTIELLVKLSSSSFHQVIISRGPKQPGHWEIYATPTSGYAGYFIKTSTADNIGESTRVITDDLWHFITLRINENTSEVVMTVDGSQVLNDTLNGTIPSTSEPIYIGALGDSEAPTQLPITGAVDETRISDIWRTAVYTPPTPFTNDINTLGLYHFDTIENLHEFPDASTYSNPAIISSAGDKYLLTTYVNDHNTWQPLFDAPHPTLEGTSFNIWPTAYSVIEDSDERKAVLLSGTQASAGYNWDVLVEANAGSPLIKFLVTCHLTSSLSIASGAQPTAALWLDQSSVDVLVEQGPMSIYGGTNYGLGFPSSYVWNQGKEAVIFFNMTPMTWMGSGNIRRFADCRIKSITQNNQFGIGLIPHAKSGNSIPAGDMVTEFYLYSSNRPDQPTKMQGLETMVEMCGEIHEATAWFPTNRQPPYELSWEVFAKKAIEQLMIAGVTSYNEVSGWDDDPLNLVPVVDYIYTHPDRPFNTGWDFSTVNNHLSPWVLYTRMVNDTAKYDLAMLKKDALPLFYDPQTKMTRWGTREPLHIGNISMSWQSFFYDIETYRTHKVLGPEDFNPAIPGRFLMGTEGLIEYGQNENYVFGQFFDPFNKVAITQQDLPDLGVIREPWQTGSYALIMMFAHDITSEAQYLQEAKTSIETLLTTMSFNVTNNYYNITYDNPADFPITELFGNAYGAVASHKVYQQTRESKYLQYSRDFLHTLLRLTFWYEDETNIYSRDLGNLGLFTPHGGAGNTTPWETTDAYIAITWLLKHFKDLPETELLLKLANLYRINSFHYYPVTYTDTVRALGISDGTNPYHPVEPFYSMEYGGHGGVPACYMSNTGMWNFWMYEALAEPDNSEIMVLNTDVLEDFDKAISSAQRNFIIFNPTAASIDFALLGKSLADGNYSVTVEYSQPHYSDINRDGKTNLPDFAFVSDQWMQAPSIPSADIAPETPDGVVSLPDLQTIDENWLKVDNATQNIYTKTQLQNGISLTLRSLEHACVTLQHENITNMASAIQEYETAQNKLAYAYKLMQVRERDFGDVSQSMITDFQSAMLDYDNQNYTSATSTAQTIIDALLP